MLNYRWFFVFVLLCGLLFIAAGVYAQVPSLYTKDGSCRYYYFTPKNTQSWYIEPSADLCEKGIVNGQGVVTVYNAFSQPIEEIYGFFNEGFWTGDMPLSASVLYQTVDSDGTQKVYFEIPNDTYYNFQLIGQMSAKKQKDGTYEAFKFCNPFRILVQTEESDVFADNQKLIDVVDTLVQKTREYCPAEETLYFYASRLKRPQLEDIFFFAEVDLRAARIMIKRNTPIEKIPYNERGTSYENFSQEAFPHQNTGQQSAGKHLQGQETNFGLQSPLGELSVEQDVLLSANGKFDKDYIKNNLSPSKRTKDVKEFNKTVHEPDLEIYEGDKTPYHKQGQANHLKQKSNRNVPLDKEGQQILPDKTEGLNDADNATLRKGDLSERQEFDKVPHLLLASKIMRKPVQGTAVVYISDVTDGIGKANKPNPLKVEGNDLSVGWAMIAGEFDYQSTSTSGKLRGKVIVDNILPCQSKQCRDIK